MKKELIVQVMIPFCTSKCVYCAEPVLGYSTGLSKRYTDALLRQIEELKEDVADYEISAISLEGGCPTLLEPGNLQTVIRALRKSFPLKEDVQISLQTMPGDYSRALMDRMRDNGVNFYIVGLQTTNPAEHELLSRPYRFDALSMVDVAIRTFPMRKLSFDVLLGIPGQTWETLEHTLDVALAYQPDHLSLMPFRVERRTPFFASVIGGEIQKMGKEQMEELRLRAEEKLKSCGYKPYTREDYCLPGGENLFRLGFMQGSEQLGLGFRSFTAMDGVMYWTGEHIEEYLRFAGNMSVLAKSVWEIEGAGAEFLEKVRKRMLPR